MKDTLSLEKFNNCLSIDIECNQNSWHVLIRRLNNEIMEKMEIIKSFHFEFRKSSDFEGITLNILTHCDDAAHLKVLTTKFLDTFIFYGASLRYSINQDVQGWDLVDDFYKCIIAKKLSDLVYKLFSKETIHTDSLISFSLIIHLGWINSRLSLDNETIDNILLKGYHLNLNNIDDTSNYHLNVREIFIENRSFIFNILKCFNQRSNRHRRAFLNWKVNWGRYCLNKKKYINGICLAFPLHKEMISYRVPFLINKQLGLSSEEILLQNSLIALAFNN